MAITGLSTLYLKMRILTVERYIPSGKSRNHLKCPSMKKFWERFKHKHEDCFNLAEFRQNLLTSVDPELYKQEVEPLLQQWEKQYGEQVPVKELETLQKLSATKRSEIEARRQYVITRLTEEGGVLK